MSELLQLALDGVIQPCISVFDFSEAPRLIEGLTKDAILGRAVVRSPRDSTAQSSELPLETH